MRRGPKMRKPGCNRAREEQENNQPVNDAANNDIAQSQADQQRFKKNRNIAGLLGFGLFRFGAGFALTTAGSLTELQTLDMVEQVLRRIARAEAT